MIPRLWCCSVQAGPIQRLAGNLPGQYTEDRGSVSISLLDYNAESHLLASKRSLRQAERAQRIAEKSRIRSYLCESLPACRPFRYIEMVNESLRSTTLSSRKTRRAGRSATFPPERPLRGRFVFGRAGATLRCSL